MTNRQGTPGSAPSYGTRFGHSAAATAWRNVPLPRQPWLHRQEAFKGTGGLLPAWRPFWIRVSGQAPGFGNSPMQGASVSIRHLPQADLRLRAGWLWPSRARRRGQPRRHVTVPERGHLPLLWSAGHGVQESDQSLHRPHLRLQGMLSEALSPPRVCQVPCNCAARRTSGAATDLGPGSFHGFLQSPTSHSRVQPGPVRGLIVHLPRSLGCLEASLW